MSQETTEWLNKNTLIGFTDRRGTAWHYRAAEQGGEPNHYPGPVPVEAVERRLFGWDAVAGPLWTTIITAEGTTPIDDPSRQVIVRPDTGTVLGVFATGYKIHQYREWLLTKVANLLDDDLAIGSAGLLRGGAVGWVSVEVPESISTPEGVTFRPNLLACTSLDGSLATTFQRVVTNVVCDNTMSIALSERGQRVKIKHSRHSDLKIAKARDALALVHTIAGEFAAEVKALCETTVTDRQWKQFLDAHVPLPADEGRSRTIAGNKRSALERLYTHDLRVAPWAGTAWGVVQAVNTYTHHEGVVRGAGRAERNMLRAVTGETDSLDRGTLDTLRAVLAA